LYPSTSTPTGSASNGINAPSSDRSGISGGAIAGIVIGALLAIAAVVLLFFYLRRRTRQQLADDAATENPDDSRKGELRDGEKPELDAGAVIPTASGPVYAKPELPGLSHRVLELESSPAPYELSLTPYELNSAASNQTRDSPTARQGGQAQQCSPALLTTPTTREQPTYSGPDHAEQVEEADLAVQELGIITVRKRRLANQAEAVGTLPAEVQGARGEEWVALTTREESIRRRLDELRAVMGDAGPA
jgi:hypothetical protein